MRLIHARSLKFVNVPSHDPPPFAILSHTWGLPSDEISFEDFEAGLEKARERISFTKLQYTAAQAIKDGLEYFWIDTCCIDKRSSAELQEAINSMFSWYTKANICYVYLSDVTDINSVEGEDSQFRKARWHTRGWTLQELIAPRNVNFYSHDWTFLGTKGTLYTVLSDITRIKVSVLNCDVPVSNASVAERMSWASGRETSRPEDIAYCLMGIFSVNMTMLYGEGEKAFLRLQEEICKESNDNSIFAWQDVDAVADEKVGCGLLAEHPRHFRDSWVVSAEDGGPNVSNGTFVAATPLAMVNQGIQMESYLLTFRPNRPHIWILVLRCRVSIPSHVKKGHISLLVRKAMLPGRGSVYVRLRSDALILSKHRPRLTETIMLAKAGSFHGAGYETLGDLQKSLYELEPIQPKNHRTFHIAPVYISRGSLTSWQVIAWTAFFRNLKTIEPNEREYIGSMNFRRDDGKQFSLLLGIYREVSVGRFFPDETTVYGGQVLWTEGPGPHNWSPMGRRVDCGEEHMVYVYADGIDDAADKKKSIPHLDFTFLIRIIPKGP